jgi:hypothetical protein
VEITHVVEEEEEVILMSKNEVATNVVEVEDNLMTNKDAVTKDKEEKDKTAVTG